MDQSLVSRSLPRDVVRRPFDTESRAVARFRPSINKAHHPSFVQLYYALEARRTSTFTPMVVQFVSPSPGAGVSTVASAYARVAAAGRPTPVLFIDGSCRSARHEAIGPERLTLVDAFERGGDILDAVLPARNAENLLWGRLCAFPDELLALGSTRLEELIRMLSGLHQLIVLDCASVQRPEAIALSRLCDGTVLVLEAGVTSQQETNAACKRIKQAGGAPVGVVLNREKLAFRPKRVQFA